MSACIILLEECGVRIPGPLNDRNELILQLHPLTCYDDLNKDRSRKPLSLVVHQTARFARCSDVYTTLWIFVGSEPFVLCVHEPNGGINWPYRKTTSSLTSAFAGTRATLSCVRADLCVPTILLFLSQTL